MTDKKRKEAISKLKQEIQKHLGTLQQLLLLESDVTLRNGCYIPQAATSYINLDKVSADKADLMITIFDLTSVCRALKHGKNHVNIYGTANKNGYILIKTCNSLEAAGLSCDGDGFTTTIWFD